MKARSQLAYPEPERPPVGFATGSLSSPPEDDRDDAVLSLSGPASWRLDRGFTDVPFLACLDRFESPLGIGFVDVGSITTASDLRHPIDVLAECRVEPRLYWSSLSAYRLLLPASDRPSATWDVDWFPLHKPIAVIDHAVVAPRSDALRWLALVLAELDKLHRDPGTVDAPSAEAIRDVRAVANAFPNEWPVPDVDLDDGAITLRWWTGDRRSNFAIVFNGKGNVVGVAGGELGAGFSPWRLATSQTKQLMEKFQAKALTRLRSPDPLHVRRGPSALAKGSPWAKIPPGR